MIDRNPRTTILVGFLLVLAGVVFPLLMVLKVLPSTFFLNILSFSASVVGLFLGLLGAAYYVSKRKRPLDVAEKGDEKNDPIPQ